MTPRLFVAVSDRFDPFWNLALEETLAERCPDGGAVLYLWRNERTVVIGRNQDPFAECDVAALERDGGHLARRASGGGAVYQDLNNLNFTFAVPTADYNVARQLSVVLRAVRSFGVEAEATGRNDLTAGGRKFSGNAFRRGARVSTHHGTLMIGVSGAEMGKYLRVAPEKLQAKGVRSVHSRVVNLSSLNPALTVEAIQPRLIEAFASVYGAPARPLEDLDTPRVEILRARYASDAWRFPPAFAGETIAGRFPWGGVELRLQTEGGRVTDCRVFSDALDEELMASLPARLVGRDRTAAALCEALPGERQELRDLRELIRRSLESGGRGEETKG